MKNLNPVCWFDIHVSNLENAKKFYETVLDIHMVDLPPEWGKQSTFPFEAQGPNATGALVETESIDSNGNNTVIYFASKDCVTEQARVEQAGGKVLRPKMPIGEFGYISLFADLDGNTIGLHSRE
ncbi:MAG: VOC family protein [Bacteroidota bacterium]